MEHHDGPVFGTPAPWSAGLDGLLDAADDAMERDHGHHDVLKFAVCTGGLQHGEVGVDVGVV